MKRVYQGLFFALCLMLLSVGVISLTDQDAKISAVENRALASRPEFTLKSWLDGSFASKFDTYYNDTFPKREALLRLNKGLNRFYYYGGTGDQILSIDYRGGAEQGGESLDGVTGAMDQQTQKPAQEEPKKPAENEAPQTPEEQQPEQPEPERQYPDEKDATSVGTILIVGDNAMDIPTATTEIIDRYSQSIDNLAEAMGPQVRTFSLVTPNSGQFYSPESFHTGVHDQKAMIQECYDHMSGSVYKVDAYSALEAHQDEYIFFRTDHHWTALGAYYAYVQFCQTAGFSPVPLSQFTSGQYDGFVGSMYTYTAGYPQSDALLQNPDTVTYYLPIVETSAKYYADATLTNGIPISVVSTAIGESVSNKYLCFISGDTPICVIESQVEGPVCMVLKESYGNAFVPFLTSHYSKIIVVDPREFNHGEKPDLDLAAFAKEQGIDDLIVINYPFMINNASYIEWLNRLVR